MSDVLLLRYREAWERLGFSRSMFFRELQRGRIRVLPTPAGPRIKVSDLEAYVALLEREAMEARQAS
jgi:hypothetical protein